MRSRIATMLTVTIVAVAVPATVAHAGAVVVKDQTCFIQGVDENGNLSATCGATGTAKVVDNNNKIKVTCKATVQNKSGAPFSEKVRVVIDFNGEKHVLTETLHISTSGEATMQVQFKQ